MNAQSRNIIKASSNYARKVYKSISNEMEREDFELIVAAAYISGVLSACEAMAFNDGVTSPSKLAEAAREAGIEMTGNQPERNTEELN